VKQLNLTAVPNGALTLEEALQNPILKTLVQQVQSAEGSEVSKIKTFLSVYQMIDALAQMRMQGMDMSQVNYEGLKDSMIMSIEVAYDSIMRTFNNHERKKLHEMFGDAPAH
jgi:hypothetical protein